MTKIPEGWIETIVELLVNDKILGKPMDGNHGNLHPKSSDFTESGVPFIMASDISNGKVDFKNCYYISESTNNTLQKGFAKPGDVLLTHKATIGKVALLGGEYPSITLTPQVTYYRVLNHDKLDNKYLYYYFLSPYFQNIFAMWSGAGSTRAYLGITDQRKLPIILPPLPEQKAIAGVLSSFDDKIELLRAENQTLEEMGQTLFKERFGKYKVGDELPNGWKWGELGEIGDQITERVKNEKERVVLSAVNSGNLVLSESYFSKQVFSEDIAKYITCDKGDFAYNPARINIGSIGRNFYWNGAVSPVYVVFRPKEKFGKYLEYIFKSERFKNHVEKYANGSVRQALNYDGFSRFELLIPNNDILEKFNENLETFEKKIEENKKQINTLISTRDQLLPKLMSGEVRVEF